MLAHSILTATQWNVILIVQATLVVKNPPPKAVQPLGWEDPLEEEMATHSSILAWKIPWVEEPGRLRHRNLDTTE